MQTNLTGENSIPTPPNYGINEVLAEIRQKSLSEREKGQDFERLMKLWFLTDPRYNNLEKVWLWEEFPGRKDFGGTDLGIDLVARTDTGDYWAIQCKCYDADATIDKVVLQIVNEQIAIPLDGIKLAANRMLGYQRRTTRIDNAITRSVARLISAKQILRDGDTLKAI